MTMNFKKYFNPLFILALCLVVGSASAQIDIVNNDTSICEGNSVNLHANTNGRIPIAIPLNTDDIYSGVINIGFPFSFYGNTYTQCVVSANGFISFDLGNAGAFSTWVLDDVTDFVPGNVNCLNSIMAAYTDIDPSVGGGSIDYALMGTAPNRRFVVSFCNSGLFSCNNLKSSFQIVLYETSNLIDIHLISQPAGLCTVWNGGHGIQGVQNGDGTLGTVTPGRNWNDVWTAYNESRRFTPVGTTNFTQALIPHAPIPDSSATITWYSGGFQVGTGHDFLFTYTTTQTLVAMVTQCQDTMTDTVTVVVNQVYNITSIDSTNPTQCEAADGTITLFGFLPGITYTVHYTNTFNVAVTTTITANSQGGLLIQGLIEGTYTNFWVVSPEGCISNTYPFVTLYDPAIVISGVTGVNPSACQGGDGAFVLGGLIPGVTYTINYLFQGNPYSVSVTADANGDVTVTGLSAGTYSSINASTPQCTSNTVGPVTITDPLPVIIAVNGFPPSLCRGTDGYLQLTGLIADSTYTIRYTLNTVPYTIVLVADANGDVIVPNLPAGVYANITATLLTCQSLPKGPVTIQNPPVTADFTYQLFPGCTEDTVVFTDNSSGSAYPFDYLWIFADDSFSTVQNPVHIYKEQGTYPVVLVVTDSVCRDSAFIDVIINHPLVANFTMDEDTICQFSSVTFTDASIATPPVSYYWDFANGETNGFSVPTATSAYNHPGNYYPTLIITDFIGCKDTISKYVRVDSLTEIKISFNDSVICAGEKVYITATYADTGSTGVNWDFGDGIVKTTFDHTIDHSYESAGLYNVHVIATGRVCPDVDSALLLQVDPQPQINLGPDTAMCPTAAPLVLADLVNGGNTAATWVWVLDRAETGDRSFNIVAKQPGIYASTVTIGECSATDSVWVRKDCYLDVPNAFTPDGDNMNDYFFPRQWLSMSVTTFKMIIYNRWGQEIYSTTNINGRGWDGKFNGVDQPQGVYVYVIDVAFKDGRSEHKQGNVTLLR
jgi:gliding motility-associated-like protein